MRGADSSALMQLLSAIPSGTDLIIFPKGAGKMLGAEIAQSLGNGGDASLAVGKQNGGGRHSGLRLFFLKGLPVKFHQKPLGLPGA